MAAQKFRLFNPFDTSHKDHVIDIHIMTHDAFTTWIKSQPAPVTATLSDAGFTAKAEQTAVTRDENGITAILHGVGDTVSLTDGSHLYNAVQKQIGQPLFENHAFKIMKADLSDAEYAHLCVGWGVAAYRFDLYKSTTAETTCPALIVHDGDLKRIQTTVEAIGLIRDLVNTPANDMGPEELEHAAQCLVDHHDVTLNTITDQALQDHNFPMIFDVGRASDRRPRLLDFSWGQSDHPKVTLVGKGVCFDTGGLDLKPSQFMLMMKKDMGGSAHVLALAHMIMSLALPIRLRVLIPAVENAVSGNAYRPSDILNSRKGLTVEVGNTDAEGRLVLADALTYASEDEPELIIDFATLTGAARIAVGLDLPALFCRDTQTARNIQDLSATEAVNDPVWHLPLHHPYRKDIDSTVADISSTGGKAGASTAALFLNEFVGEGIEWIHMDIFSWEQNGRVGRPKGGADTGLRAIFAYLEQRYGH